MAEFHWVKSSRSLENSACIEVARTSRVYVRDTKDSQDGPVLVFTASSWRAFLGQVRSM